MPTPGEARYPALQLDFLLAAVGLSLSLGLTTAAMLGGAWAGLWPIEGWWPGVVRAHGHVQLVGFVGLFVLGVGFQFLPRLRGAPVRRLGWIPLVGALLTVGVALRAVAFLSRLPWLGAVGAAVELLAAAGVIAVLGPTMLRGPRLAKRRGFLQVLPLLATAGASFVAALALEAAGRSGAELLIHGFAVSMALAVAVRTLPTFLRSRLPGRRPVQALGVAHAVAVVWAQVAPAAEAPIFLDLAAVFGILALTDLPLRLSPRGPVPGAGRWGAWRWLVQGAFAWLAVGEVLRLVHPNAARHALTTGFLLCLIAGMAIRMASEMAGVRIRSRRAVGAMAVLLHVAALVRVSVPLAGPASAPLMALAAPLAWLGVLLLGRELWTWRVRTAPPASSPASAPIPDTQPRRAHTP